MESHSAAKQELASLYLVRWPNLSAALVRAVDEKQLIDILDEIGNPDGCTWSEYDGPIFLDFDLPARIVVRPDESEDDAAHRPLDPTRIDIVGAAALLEQSRPLMAIRVAGETGAAMEKAIARFAFPATASVLYDELRDTDLEQLEQALRDDAMRLVEYSWRRSGLHRSRDPDAKLALQMDTSVRWVKDARERMEAADEHYELPDAVKQTHRSVANDGGERRAGPTRDEVDHSIAELLEMARDDWQRKRDAGELRRSLVELLLIVEARLADNPRD